MGGEQKAGLSTHSNRKAAIVRSLKCTDNHSLLESVANSSLTPNVAYWCTPEALYAP